MTIRSDLEKAIESAGFSIGDLRTKTYGDKTHKYRTYVMLSNYARGTGEVVDLQVCVASPINGEIEEASKEVWGALGKMTKFQPVSVSWEYGATPVPGRDMPPADLARIIVISDQKLD